MLLTTTNNNIYILDAYGGEKVCFPVEIILYSLWVCYNNMPKI